MEGSTLDFFLGKSGKS